MKFPKELFCPYWTHNDNIKERKCRSTSWKCFCMLQTCTLIASNWQYEFCAFYLEERVQYLHVWSPSYSRVSFIQCQRPQNIRLFERRLGRFLWAKALQMQMSGLFFWHGNSSASAKKKKSLDLLPSPILDTHLLETVNYNCVFWLPKMLADYPSSHEYLYW